MLFENIYIYFLIMENKKQFLIIKFAFYIFILNNKKNYFKP